MTAVPATREMIYDICYRLDQGEAAEHAMLSWDGEYHPEQVAGRIWAQVESGMTTGIAIIDKTGQAQVCGGLTFSRPRVAVTWSLGTSEIRRYVIELTRVTRRLFDAALSTGKVLRIETWSHAGRTDAHRWYRSLGLVPEAILRAWCGGEDFIVFCRLAED